MVVSRRAHRRGLIPTTHRCECRCSGPAVCDFAGRIIGVGTDIVKTARFERMTEHFMARVFTPRERAYLMHKSHVSAAGFFAAKEAVAKALGTGFKGFWPAKIEIVHDCHGKPYVVLHDEAARIAKRLASAVVRDSGTAPKAKYRCHKYAVDISISHTCDDAIAFAVLSIK